jgi:chromosome segregation ATPase
MSVSVSGFMDWMVRGGGGGKSVSADHTLIDELKSKMHTLLGELHKADEQLAQVTISNKDLRRQLIQARKKSTDDRMLSNAQMEQKISELTTKYDNRIRELIESADKNSKEMKDNISTLSEELRCKGKTIGVVQTKLQEVSSKFDAEVAQSKKKDVIIGELKNALKKSAEAFKEQQESMQAKFKQQLKQSVNCIKEKQSHIDSLERQLEAAQSELRHAQWELKSNEGVCEKLLDAEKTQDDLKKHLQEAESKLGHVEIDLQLKNAQISSLQKRLEEANSRLEDSYAIGAFQIDEDTNIEKASIVNLDLQHQDEEEEEKIETPTPMASVPSPEAEEVQKSKYSFDDIIQMRLKEADDEKQLEILASFTNGEFREDAIHYAQQHLGELRPQIEIFLEKDEAVIILHPELSLCLRK